MAVLPCMLGDQEAALTRLTPHVLARQTFSLAYRRELRNFDSARAAIGFVRTVIRQNAGLIGGVRTSRGSWADHESNADLAHGRWVTVVHLSSDPTRFKADIMKEKRA